MTLKERIENRGTTGGGWECRATLVKGAAATVSLHPVSAYVKVPEVVPYSSFVHDRRDASRSLYSRDADQWCEGGGSRVIRGLGGGTSRRLLSFIGPFEEPTLKLLLLLPLYLRARGSLAPGFCNTTTG